MSATILVVDDDPGLRELLAEELGGADYRVLTAASADEAIERIGRDAVDVVVTDLRMPGPSGVDLCRDVVRLFPEVPVILMTGFGSMDAAVEAIRAGAYDFLTKPFETEALELTLERALRTRSLQAEVRRLRRQTGDQPGFAGMIGTSGPMERLYELVDQIGRSEASVLIQGESGSGKELVARALHGRSRRAEGSFVAVNCAAVPEQLMESELFGHERGAFTDARSARRGLMREGAKGTLFLDEIGDLPLTIQPKLLRALQERKIRPVGGDHEIDVDVRIVAATHHDLKAAVEEGRFRADLYYRLNVITVDVPALRERGDDVLLLADFFLEQLANRDARPALELSESVARRLRLYDWPGNVRELRNAMERCVALATGESIEVSHLPPELAALPEPRPLVDEGEDPPFVPLFDVERRHILRVIDAVEGNKSRAARILGIDRKTLHARLVRYGRE